MSKPVIPTVDDYPAVSAAIARALRRRSAVGERAMSIYLVHRYLATV
jgi:hypothetical protein